MEMVKEIMDLQKVGVSVYLTEEGFKQLCAMISQENSDLAQIGENIV
jgi:hypothetical protein